VLLGVGDGTFGPAHLYPAGSDPIGVALADLNHDAKLDLAVANYEDGSVSVFPGRGDGTFNASSAYEMTAGTEYIVVADFDADGNPDIATASVDDAPAVARGRADGTFEAARPLGMGGLPGCSRRLRCDLHRRPRKRQGAASQPLRKDHDNRSLATR
jgi:hypothetical protein